MSPYLPSSRRIRKLIVPGTPTSEADVGVTLLRKSCDRRKLDATLLIHRV